MELVPKKGLIAEAYSTQTATGDTPGFAARVARVPILLTEPMRLLRPAFESGRKHLNFPDGATTGDI